MQSLRMKVAHLILTHKNPKQVERLIKALSHTAFDIYIHVDKKSDIEQFRYLADNKNIFFIEKRAKIYWAAYGTIQATINGFEEILLKQYDYINVISGQDFPLKSADDIYQFFRDGAGKEFITCLSIEREWTEAQVRLKKYWLINKRIPGRHKLENIINKILPERKFPLKDFIMVGRSNWFAITSDAAKYIMAFMKENPKVVRFYKNTWGADECIFSTILYNSDFKNNIEENLVYTDWSEQKAHPKIFTANDYNALISSGKVFARKFDIAVDGKIINMLENFVAK